MNNNILLAIPLAVAPLLLTLITQLALLLALFLALIVVVIIINVVLQSIPLSHLLHDYFMVQESFTFTALFYAASLLLYAVGSLIVLLIGSRCKPVSNTYLTSATVVSLDCMYQYGARSTRLK